MLTSTSPLGTGRRPGLLLAGLLALAAPALPARAAVPAAAPADGETLHAMRGIVKAVGPSILVVTRPGRHPTDTAFALTGATARNGAIEVGVAVSVRYRLVAGRCIAIGISRQTALHP